MTSSIRSPAERSLLPVLVAVALALSPLSVRAANVDAGAHVESQARAKFSEGNIAYDLGEFQKALDAYSEAYRLMPLPGFLFNIAQCHRQMGRPERAGFFYRRYLTLSKAPSNAALVGELIVEMDEEVRREQERRQAREETARDQAKAAALRAQAEAIAARRVQQGDGKRALVPRSRASAESTAQVKGDHLLTKWWVWAGAGAVAVIAGGVIYAATAPQPRPTTLGTVR